MAEKNYQDVCSRRTCAVLYYHEPMRRNGAQPGISGAKIGQRFHPEKAIADVYNPFHAVLEAADQARDTVQHGFSGLKRVFGAAAFRKYNIWKDTRVKNIAGDFRGLVVNKKLRVAYEYVSKQAEGFESATKRVEHVAHFLSFAQEAVTSAEAVRRIMASSDDRATKGAKISFEVSAMSLRYIDKLGTGSIGTLAFAMRAMGFGALNESADRLERLQARVDSRLDSSLTGENIDMVVTHVVTWMQR